MAGEIQRQNSHIYDYIGGDQIYLLVFVVLF